MRAPAALPARPPRPSHHAARRSGRSRRSARLRRSRGGHGRWLRRRRRMRLQLTALAVALLSAEAAGQPPLDLAARARPASSGITGRAAFELAGYSDTDAVEVLTATVAGTVGDEVAGWSLSGRYLLDAVSAASVDIVATASRRWFELRHVGSGSFDWKQGDVAVSLSGNLSREPDYLSIGGGVTVAIDLLDKNVTPFATLAYGHDDVGRTGLPLGRWDQMQRLAGQGGATFVVDRATIASVAVDAIRESGYLAKPYRYIPLFAPGTGVSIPAGASIDEVNRERLDMRPMDALPRARDRYAVTARLAPRFDATTARVDQRLYHDDWGLQASTTDLRVLLDAGRRLTLGP